MTLWEQIFVVCSFTLTHYIFLYFFVASRPQLDGTGETEEKSTR